MIKNSNPSDLTQEPTQNFKFELVYQSTKSQARVGRIHTPHGVIDTPNFVAVGTNGSLKALPNHELDKLGLQLMFCNTYHLLVQPGTNVIEQAGGLHEFIQRKSPIITDSGGFQVFSLAYGGVASELKSKGTKNYNSSVLKVSEEGVVFRSYYNGEKIKLTPESSIQAQKSFGSDIIIPLDELLPYHVDEKQHLDSFERTHRWEKRSLEEHLKNPNNQAIYSVIHGRIDKKMRQKSCDILGQQAFNGHAIGGSLGKDIDELYETVKLTTPCLPEDKPRHLLGIGDLPSLDRCVPLGIDTFDSAYPTRSARHGILFTFDGPLKLTRQTHKNEHFPVDIDCHCPLCKNYSRAYVHHLFKAKEPVVLALASAHNVAFMMRKMQRYRDQILSGLI